ncbi:hypothetical protein [Natronorarus salvus]|uniref:hypothetical protein n=1 Tax=Natronorarus salvus TaxID=3117733 RepID=UPI002F26AB08
MDDTMLVLVGVQVPLVGLSAHVVIPESNTFWVLAFSSLFVGTGIVGVAVASSGLDD